MAYQNARKVTEAAKGDARNNGAPGPTPAPVKKYVEPLPGEKDEVTGYGAARNFGPSSVEPGHTQTSSLADELKRMNALSDAGDHLQDVINHGTARNTAVDIGQETGSQLRNVSAEPYPAAHGMRDRNANPVTIPDKTGMVESNPVRKPI